LYYVSQADVVVAAAEAQLGQVQVQFQLLSRPKLIQIALSLFFLKSKKF
jgi:hypothetical protein